MAFGVKTANMFELLGDEEGFSAPSKPVAKAQAETKKSTPGKGSLFGQMIIFVSQFL